MARALDVYLHTDLAGHLTQDDDGDMSFQYAADHSLPDMRSGARRETP